MIVFEGIDCSGKTTAIQYAKKKLEQLGKDVIIMDDWSGDKGLKQELLDTLGNNPESIRAQFDIVLKARKKTLKCLEHLEQKGKTTIVLYDRYVISTLIYQVLKLPVTQREPFIKVLKESIVPFDLVVIDISDDFPRQKFLSNRDNTPQDLKDQTQNIKDFRSVFDTQEFKELSPFIKTQTTITNSGSEDFFKNLDSWISKNF